MLEALGKYRVVGRLGIGGMAEIYLCLEPGAAREVVIKRIRADLANDREFIAMFLDEARIASHLAHPNVVKIFEAEVIDELPCIAMEYVAGHTLGSLIAALRGRDSVAARSSIHYYSNLAHVIADACAGLDHAHGAHDEDGRALDIVHRDISPHNVIISRTGVAKVFDFGVAKARGALGISGAGTLKGKVGYMAPEQLRAQPVDARADVYAIGVCLYEATVGERPFRGQTEGELYAARLDGSFARPTDAVAGFPAELEQLILRAMAPAPADRPTAAELERQLRALALASAASPRTVASWLGELFPDGPLPCSVRASQPPPEPLPAEASAPVVAVATERTAPARRPRAPWLVALGIAFLGGGATAMVATRRAPDPVATTEPALAPTPPAAPPAARPVPVVRTPEPEPEPIWTFELDGEYRAEAGVPVRAPP